MEQRSRLTAVLTKLNQPSLVPIRKLAADYFRSAIGASVVHQEQLVITSPCASKTAKLVQQAPHDIFFVVDRNDDRIVRLGCSCSRGVHWELRIILVPSAMNR